MDRHEATAVVSEIIEHIDFTKPVPTKDWLLALDSLVTLVQSTWENGFKEGALVTKTVLTPITKPRWEPIKPRDIGVHQHVAVTWLDRDINANRSINGTVAGRNHMMMSVEVPVDDKGTMFRYEIQFADIVELQYRIK